jgi:hypothetical protein
LYHFSLFLTASSISFSSVSACLNCSFDKSCCAVLRRISSSRCLESFSSLLMRRYRLAISACRWRLLVCRFFLLWFCWSIAFSYHLCLDCIYYTDCSFSIRPYSYLSSTV